jgi:hypothetical protein
MNQPWVDNPPRELSFKAVLQKLEPNGDGVFVRAPGMDPYGRQTDGAGQGYGFTHDQLVPLVAAMGVWGRARCVAKTLACPPGGHLREA